MYEEVNKQNIVGIDTFRKQKQIEDKRRSRDMLGDNSPMLAPPIATGPVDFHRDDESVGVSSRGRQVMSDRGRGQDF